MNSAATDAEAQSRVAAVAQALRQLGWVQGQNIGIDLRWNAGDAALARIYPAQASLMILCLPCSIGDPTEGQA
jgi:hypothetical protein